MIRAAPVTSSTVSPFIRSAVMKAPIWAGVAFPSMISVMIGHHLRFLQVLPWTTLAMASRIMCHTSPFLFPDDRLQEISDESVSRSA